LRVARAQPKGCTLYAWLHHERPYSARDNRRCAGPARIDSRIRQRTQRAVLYFETNLERLVTRFRRDTQLILDGTYFIAEVEREVAGSGGWSKRKTLFGGDQAKADRAESLPATSLDALLDPATDAARIRAFYVHPQWSRKALLA